ncbi:hypothetical protein GLI01_05670 [Gluconacetobacter liquefaciens]|uniref:Capsular biosynthesis protein n=1 Tax=Gluconacetobacter liquefaciens TaxID=89584 RepID=A0A370GA96_GLULI|nr:capsular biosynthesis protein [Gluconacetobacter liquefaciens]MBB2186350.1 capsular biosynthesis protein [Gluconacetobacter liquefaciens]RDI38893.1 hypothetical protein C7453_103354 [Gluconacetobacter liquefaciens]GBR05140.1 capsular polysaccharide biosynthesis protein [Gluconacetobacter liquefaciens NRIC 0522]GEB36532.1 hypothetical protein GLI01_05670 [Gluconacetobacter liquefaciens]
MIHPNLISVIASGAYVSHELVAEFGPLPPAFLPLGVGRLYDMQIASLKQDLTEASPIYITLPESFDVPAHDLQSFKDKGVTPIFVPDGLDLGASIVFAVNSISAYSAGIRVLHGDTLLDRLPSGLDVVASHAEGDDYCWAAINHSGTQIESLELIEAASETQLSRPVACGYFAFSSCSELVRAMVRSGYDFLRGVNAYNRLHPMRMDNIEHWYDFGHLQTYFHSRRMVTTARSFNSLQITRNTVKKLSTDAFKMQAEANWFARIPADARPYSARLLDQGQDGTRAFYSTEYQYAPNLSELFVFSGIGRITWQKLLSSCTEFLEICASHEGEIPRAHYARQLMGKKTVERLERYARESGFDIAKPLSLNGRPMPSLAEIATSLEGMISVPDAAEPSTIMHGDFCFSNILYNSRNNRISVIDPRGYVSSGEHDIYGDIRYDIAKLSHSINGLYDLIIAGRYRLTQQNMYSFSLEFPPSSQRNWLRNQFADLTIAGISTASQEIGAITTSLFVSMLPLHADRPDRQAAFIANALRLFSALEGKPA